MRWRGVVDFVGFNMAPRKWTRISESVAELDRCAYLVDVGQGIVVLHQVAQGHRISVVGALRLERVSLDAVAVRVKTSLSVRRRRRTENTQNKNESVAVAVAGCSFDFILFGVSFAAAADETERRRGWAAPRLDLDFPAAGEISRQTRSAQPTTTTTTKKKHQNRFRPWRFHAILLLLLQMKSWEGGRRGGRIQLVRCSLLLCSSLCFALLSINGGLTSNETGRRYFRVNFFFACVCVQIQRRTFSFLFSFSFAARHFHWHRRRSRTVGEGHSFTKLWEGRAVQEWESRPKTAKCPLAIPLKLNT